MKQILQIVKTERHILYHITTKSQYRGMYDAKATGYFQTDLRQSKK